MIRFRGFRKDFTDLDSGGVASHRLVVGPLRKNEGLRSLFLEVFNAGASVSIECNISARVFKGDFSRTAGAFSNGIPIWRTAQGEAVSETNINVRANGSALGSAYSSMHPVGYTAESDGEWVVFQLTDLAAAGTLKFGSMACAVESLDLTRGSL